MKVNLSDVIEAIEFEGELLSHYYNKETGIIIYVEDESTTNYKASDIKDIEKFEDWERELIKGLYDLKHNPEKYIQLPTKEEINEDAMMRDFLKCIENNNINSEDLEGYSIMKLKEKIESIGKLNQWYDYRENKEYEIAKNWCINNNIPYVDIREC